MRAVAEVNKYVSDMAPWQLKGEDERERLATVLHVTVQAVADCNLMLAPFLPHSANAVDQVWAAPATSRRCRRSARWTTWTAGPATPS